MRLKEFDTPVLPQRNVHSASWSSPTKEAPSYKRVLRAPEGHYESRKKGRFRKETWDALGVSLEMFLRKISALEGKASNSNTVQRGVRVLVGVPGTHLPGAWPQDLHPPPPSMCP